MKNKKLTYVLGLAVLVIWGLLIYKVFIAFEGNDDEPVASLPAPSKSSYNDYAVQKDTTHLLLNYRDPFGLVKFKDTTTMVTKHHSSGNVNFVQKPATNWDFIKYLGYIRNPNSKKLIAILTINGKSIEMAEGETSANVKLLKNMRDSVKVSFNGHTKFITMHSGII